MARNSRWRRHRSATPPTTGMATHCPPDTAEVAAKSDAILFGAAGTYESDLRPPEAVAAGLCRSRKAARPLRQFPPGLRHSRAHWRFHPEARGDRGRRPRGAARVDLRHLFRHAAPRARWAQSGQRSAFNTMRYSEAEIAAGPPCGLRGGHGSTTSSSARSIRPMCWRPACSGARWRTRWRATTPMSRCATNTWMPRRCT